MRIVLSEPFRQALDTSARVVPAPLIYRPEQRLNGDKSRLIVVVPDHRMRRRIRGWCGGRNRCSFNVDLDAYVVHGKYLQQVAQGVAELYGRCWVVVDHQPVTRCDTRCRRAQGWYCDCRCLGRHHGGSIYLNGWHHVGDTTLIRYHNVIRSKYIVHKEESPMIPCESGLPLRQCTSKAAIEVETTEAEVWTFCDEHFGRFQDLVNKINREDPDNMMDYAFRELTDADHAARA